MNVKTNIILLGVLLLIAYLCVLNWGSMVLGGCLFAGILIWLYSRPVDGIYLIAFLIPWEFLQVIPGIEMTLSKIITFILLLVFVVRNLYQLNQVVIPPKITLIFFLFVGWTCLSAVLNNSLDMAYTPIKSLVSYYLMIFLMVNYIRDEKRYIDVIKIFIISVTLVSLYSIFSYAGILGGGKLLGDSNQYRAIGGYDDPNKFGGILMYAICLLTVEVFDRIKGEGSRWKYFSYGIIWIAIVLTFSRGTWIVALFIMFLYPLLTRRYRIWLLGIVMLGMLVIIFWNGIAGRLELGIKFKDLSVEDRKVTNRAALVLIRDNPWFGVGLNQSLFAVRPYKKEMGGYYVPDTGIHNLYLNLAAETGLPGILLFLWFQLVVIKMAYTLFRYSKKKRYNQYGLGLLLITVAFLVHNLFVAFIYISLYWFMLGLIVAIYQHSRLQEETDINSTGLLK